MNKEDNNRFENRWDEMTKTFQNQFSVWLKMSEDYLDHMTDLQTRMFQNLQKQYRISNENSEKSLKASKFTTNKEAKEKVTESNEVLNADTIDGDWKQLMGDIQKQWNKITNDNLEQINGSREKLSGVLQKNYSIARAEAEKQMRDWENTRAKLSKTANR